MGQILTNHLQSSQVYFTQGVIFCYYLYVLILFKKAIAEAIVFFCERGTKGRKTKVKVSKSSVTALFDKLEFVLH